MINWFKQLFKKKENPYIHIFDNWIYDGSYLTSPDYKYKLWVANGFRYFKDADYFGIRDHKWLHVSSMPYKERKLLWEAFSKHYINRITKEAIRDLEQLRGINVNRDI